MLNKKITVLGIDPGNVRTGYGIIEKKGKTLKYLTSGILNIKDSKNIGEQLYNLEKDLKKIISKYKPKIAGVEELFFYKNIKTALKVLEARGIIYKTLYEEKIEIKEFKPQQVKFFIASYGKASKKDVSKMVSLFLKINTSKLIDDETDALAIAILTAQEKY
jgi:crossover junction endodeoxyribonuclease RuvC